MLLLAKSSQITKKNRLFYPVLRSDDLLLNLKNIVFCRAKKIIFKKYQKKYFKVPKKFLPFCFEFQNKMRMFAEMTTL